MTYYWIKKDVLLFNINDYPELKDIPYDTLIKYLKETVITTTIPLSVEGLTYFTNNGSVIGTINNDAFGNYFGTLRLFEGVPRHKVKRISNILFERDKNKKIIGISALQINK